MSLLSRKALGQVVSEQSRNAHAWDEGASLGWGEGETHKKGPVPALCLAQLAVEEQESRRGACSARRGQTLASLLGAVGLGMISAVLGLCHSDA